MSKHPLQRRWAIVASTLLLLAAGRTGAHAQTVPVTPPPAPLCHGWIPLLVTGDQVGSPSAMAVRSADDIWNVSYTTSGDTNRTTTLIRHWNGNVWTKVPSPNPDPDRNMLNAVVVPAADDAWAVGARGDGGGTQGLILHWDGTTWQGVAAPALTGVTLNALAATGRDDVWAVGSHQSTALVLHWDGRTWSQAALPSVTLDPRSSQQLHITALSRDSVWLAGSETGQGEKALLLHWDGRAWSRMDLPRVADQSFLTGVAGSSPSDVWVVGGAGGMMAIDEYRAIVLHWDGHTWSSIPFPFLQAEVNATPLSSIAVVNPTAVWIAAGTLGAQTLFHWNGSTWIQARDPLPNTPLVEILALSVVGGELWAAGGNQPMLVHRGVDCPDSRAFPQTGHTVADPLLAYWEQHGALAQQGFPLTELHAEASPTDGKMYQTQYFERAVFEQHPENAPPYDILLSLLGVEAYAQRYGAAGAPGQHVNLDRARVFSETGHTVGGDFRLYWEAHGGLAQQGYPISEEFQERNALNGQTYTVQYFQRAVFEYHPENLGTPWVVLLSQLGRFAAQRRGLIAP